MKNSFPILLRIVEFKRIDRVPTLESTRKAVDDWLKQWTVENNFKARLAIAGEGGSFENAVRPMLEEAIQTGNQHGFDARNFRVKIVVNGTDDGHFWINDHSNCLVYDLADAPDFKPVL